MNVLKIMLFSVILSVLLFYSCSEPTENSEYIEPEFVYINKSLDVVLCKRIYAWNDCLDSTYYTGLTPYYIGKYEVTNEEYSNFVTDGGYEHSVYWTEEGWRACRDSNWTKPLYWSSGKFGWEDDPYSNAIDAPVHAISFYEAEAYCKWLSIRTGKDYHLPTTPQWVRAAKGPLPGKLYPWGDGFDETKAHYAIETIDGPTTLVSARSFPQGRSEDSCYHMVGNVEEYV